jgi:RNA polymerase sigma-70 factor (ECF subfamily)
MAKQPIGSAGATRITVEDALLVEQARGGDMGAFSRLVTKYQDRLVNTCWRISGNLDDAQDLAQEAFLHALEKLDTFKHKAGFYTWLFRIAVNLSISHRRKSARAVKLSLHGPDGQWRGDHQAARLVNRVSNEPSDPPARLSQREMGRLVAEGVEELDDDHRAVVVLRDVEGFNYEQIGEILELPIGTVKSRLHRARMELRQRLRPVVEAG